MAEPHDVEADLTLEIDGQNVSPEKFLTGVRAFFGVLGAVTKDVCEGRQRVDWRVQVKAGSNLVGVAAVPGHPRHLVETIGDIVLDGIESLEKEAEEPKGFPVGAVRHLRDLGNIAGIKETDDTQVRVWVRRKPVEVTHKSVAHTADLLRERYEDHGSIEGRLQMVSERGSMHFLVYEPVWDKSVRCYVGEDLTEIALENFGKRVEVYGPIKYRKDGTPISIRVEELVQFPETATDFKSVHGILRNYR